MRVTDIVFQSPEHVIEEVRAMNVKGGSPFGRAAAWAFHLACEQERFDSIQALRGRLDDIAGQLKALKPTMATIANSKLLVDKRLDSLGEGISPAQAAAEIARLCGKMIEHSFDAVDRLGALGANLIEDHMTVMMHSYSSTLMSVFEQAAAKGTRFRVICTESRPLRESRLAARMLSGWGVPVLYITDAEIWEFMPEADLIIMGADTIAWNGSVANKMGTAMVSHLALSCKKSVYIASELFKLDCRTAGGFPVTLERRTAAEVVSSEDFGGSSGIEVINQFFDLTPAWQIAGLITEYGVIPPVSVGAYWAKFEEELFS